MHILRKTNISKPGMPTEPGIEISHRTRTYMMVYTLTLFKNVHRIVMCLLGPKHCYRGAAREATIESKYADCGLKSVQTLQHICLTHCRRIKNNLKILAE